MRKAGVISRIKLYLLSPLILLLTLIAAAYWQMPGRTATKEIKDMLGNSNLLRALTEIDHLRQHIQLDDLRRGISQVDDSQLPGLIDRLMVAKGKELILLQDALLDHRMSVIPKLWSSLETMKTSDKRLLSVASTLLRYDPRSPKWSAYLQKVSESLTLSNPAETESWVNALSPLRDELVEPLVAIHKDEKLSKTQRAFAVRALFYCRRKK